MTPEELLEKYGYQDKMVDIIALAKKLNFEVFIGKMEILKEDFGILMVYKSKNTRAIKISNKQSRESIRFAIAYLLAAYIENGNDEKFAVKANFKEFLREENKHLIDFTIEILLPNKLLNDRIAGLGTLKYENFQSLKDEFVVPDKVLQKKIKNMGDE